MSDADRVLAAAAPRPAGVSLTRHQNAVVGVVALGGIAGSCLRYGAALLWPTAPGTFPWTTLLVNLTGCTAMGLLMAVITTLPTVHPLTRPFLGTGILGGFTTFSAYALDTQRLLAAGRTTTALLYLAATVVLALVGVTAGTLLTRLALAAAPRAEQLLSRRTR